MRKIIISIFTVLFGLCAFGQIQPPMKVKKEDFAKLKPSTSMVFAGGNMDEITKKIVEGGDSVKISINLNGNNPQNSENNIAINEVEDRFANGQMKSSGMHTISNNKDAQWYVFREDGSLKSMEFYVNGVLNGPYADYHQNGQASLICSFVNGKQHGISKSYYENGAIREEVTHKNGLKNGKMTQYFQNGKPSLIALFVDDQPSGAFTDFYENGNKKKEGTLNAGEMVGTWKHYYESGKVTREENWSSTSGKLDGSHKGFYENGKPKHVSAYKNGVEDCPTYKEWYENGNLKMEGAVVNGKESGIWKFYDEAGKVTEKQY